MGEELTKKRQERRDEISKFTDIQVEAVRDELATLIMKLDADQSNINVVSSELYPRAWGDCENFGHRGMEQG